MEKSKDLAPSTPPQPRKHRRFSLQYPVHMKVHGTDSVVELDAVSRNISIGGLLLETSFPLPPHTPVSFIVTVRSYQVVRPLQFAGEGKVVRVDSGTAEEAFAIAVECNKPIIQVGDYLAPTGC